MTPAQRVIATLVEKHPRDSARLLGGYTDENAARVLESLLPSAAVRVVEHMDPLLVAGALAAMAPGSAAGVVGVLPLRAAAAALRRMAAQARGPLVAELAPKHAERLRTLLSFGPGTAGSLMDPEALAVNEDVPAHEALERVHRYADHVAHYVYVVDAGVLKGAVSLRQLVGAADDATMVSLMSTRLATLGPHESVDGVVSHPAWERLVALPVVDDDQRFLGALRHTTVRSLEMELRQSDRRRRPPETGRALAELFGLAVSGALEWPTALLGATDGDRS